jgi:23S rRNA (guanine1835-N2)-methyltransferase
MFPQPQQLSLQRFPKTSDKSLRAWSAADELVVDHLQQVYCGNAEQTSHKQPLPTHTLIINDQFGALTTSLNELTPIFWTDSYLSYRAIQANLAANFHDNNRAKPLPDGLWNQDNGAIRIDLSHELRFNLVVLRIPKHLSLLEFQLAQIKPWLKPQTLIVGAGMTKDIHNSTTQIFQQNLGPTSTSLARKKARLIFCEPQNFEPQPVNLSQYRLDQHGLEIVGLPGVFSRDKLDMGTRVLLPFLPELKPQDKAVDLGCGGGVIGAVLAKQQPQAHILLCDESALAVASARLTFQKNQLTNAKFMQTDVFHQVEGSDFKHIICNPPFHQQNVQTLSIAQKMFRQSAKKLALDGEFRVVANRHLNYLPILKRYFNKVEALSGASKFTVWLATMPKQSGEN